MYFVGTGLNLIPGYYYDRMGPRRTALRGVGLTVISWTLVSVVTLVPDVFHGKYIALSMLFLAAGMYMDPTYMKHSVKEKIQLID